MSRERQLSRRILHEGCFDGERAAVDVDHDQQEESLILCAARDVNLRLNLKDDKGVSRLYGDKLITAQAECQTGISPPVRSPI